MDAESGPDPDKNQPTRPFGEVQGHLQSNGAAQTVTDDGALTHLKGPREGPLRPQNSQGPCRMRVREKPPVPGKIESKDMKSEKTA